MSSLDGQRVVLTQSFLYQFGGSEVMTLEIAHELARQGAEVVVVVHGHSEEMARDLTAVPGIRLIRTSDPALEGVLAEAPVDIAWIHHQLIPERLLRERAGTRFVFNHMSSFHPLEFAWAHRIEAALAGAVLFPAPEARVAQVETGLLAGVDPAYLQVLGNPSPDAFAANGRGPAAELGRLLVVSNHIPPELAEALPSLRERWDVTVVGQQAELGAVRRRVTPDLVHEQDAVVTIGKTVQYSLAAGVPVFCYDHFGGPGWLDGSNVALAAEHNFSGRGFSARSGPTELVDEITAGYATARAGVGALASYAPLLGDRLREVLATVGEPSAVPLDEADITAHVAVQSSLGIFMVMSSELEEARRWYADNTAELEDARVALTTRVTALEERSTGLESAVAQALGREEELAATYREARWWVEKHEQDAAALREALATSEEQTEAAASVVRALTAELEAARAEAAGLVDRLAESEDSRRDLERSRLYRYTKHSRRTGRRQ
ncbi:hypothetical protein [Cellulomonas biazotea]|uniref:Glycosyltransferase subfamily 4-like N-terminal domain-containing protein n=1 Tax=Cellulomonas biazotea TaxID=1709 RepID=A0A402DQ74_9CELL|nr:hypothetical protein [Cellulomonas biazotea]GCE76277.1 hypothetical protein CBZ_13330 [Cellulomonas biazotea]